MEYFQYFFSFIFIVYRDVFLVKNEIIFRLTGNNHSVNVNVVIARIVSESRRVSQSVDAKIVFRIQSEKIGNGSRRAIGSAHQRNDLRFQIPALFDYRSEERRVGKECRCRWW